MIQVRKGSERGHADHGWLQSWHTFSFADYHDPAEMGWHGLRVINEDIVQPGKGFGNLRVINDDRIAPGTGFGTHGHRDMEIVSYVLDGALEHKDSMGNGAEDGAHAGIIRPGDVQRMSAGTGVMHSEFNHASDRVTHFLQIWILPRERGIAPGYEQKHFDAASKRSSLRLVASPDGAQGSVTLHADATLSAGLFTGSERFEQALNPRRIAYVHLVRGSLRVNGIQLHSGDAVRLDQESQLVLEGGEDAEVLVFDLAP